MRTFLLAIFWVTNLGGVIQVLIIVTASWISFSGAYSFFDLSVGVFITQSVPWLLWLKTIVVDVLGDFGYRLLDIPILIIAPLKMVVGLIVGLWAYSVAKGMAAEPTHA